MEPGKWVTPPPPGVVGRRRRESRPGGWRGCDPACGPAASLPVGWWSGLRVGGIVVGRLVVRLAGRRPALLLVGWWFGGAVRWRCPFGATVGAARCSRRVAKIWLDHRRELNVTAMTSWFDPALDKAGDGGSASVRFAAESASTRLRVVRGGGRLPVGCWAGQAGMGPGRVCQPGFRPAGSLHRPARWTPVRFASGYVPRKPAGYSPAIGVLASGDRLVGRRLLGGDPCGAAGCSAVVAEWDGRLPADGRSVGWPAAGRRSPGGAGCQAGVAWWGGRLLGGGRLVGRAATGRWLLDEGGRRRWSGVTRWASGPRGSGRR